ncbi:ATP-binding protein [Paraneptunicella aestuarii]|uniref:ATP-binding protein n=1 Tax=Paraneptunicella aestuarii TaxID=2831148 RepID=UPI001E555EC9|nr:ATP-binding protein [Paraneptunicella aestuarii]UAA39334.1 ATP-binding protein [Paraneptunicella aestuarii]
MHDSATAMISDTLKKDISNRSFWEQRTTSLLLPSNNVKRTEPLSKLHKLDKTNVVTAIMGQRRCGKSIVARQYIELLWNEKIPARNILYVNFFLRPLAELKKEALFNNAVAWWFETQVAPGQPSYLILDEVQELENWDENIASIFEDPMLPCRIIVTGSNSKMLSEELAHSLGGRYTTLQIFPFSFDEFCRYKQLPSTLNNFETYLNTGGMPEVINTPDTEQRTTLISDIINSTVKHDIIARYNPSNPKLLHDLVDYCRTAFAQELSIPKIAKDILKNLPEQQSTSLLNEYLGYMADVFFVYLPQTYSYRTRDILKRGVNKIYLGDLCLADYPENTQKGRLLENFVFIQLLRKGYQVQRYFAYKNRNLEIDFWAQKKDSTMLIQVCWQLGDLQENSPLWEREFGNLQHTKLDVNKYVVSMDENIQSPYRTIEHLNVLQFVGMLG